MSTTPPMRAIFSQSRVGPTGLREVFSTSPLGLREEPDEVDDPGAGFDFGPEDEWFGPDGTRLSGGQPNVPNPAPPGSRSFEYVHAPEKQPASQSRPDSGMIGYDFGDDPKDLSQVESAHLETKQVRTRLGEEDPELLPEFDRLMGVYWDEQSGRHADGDDQLQHAIRSPMHARRIAGKLLGTSWNGMPRTMNGSPRPGDDDFEVQHPAGHAAGVGDRPSRVVANKKGSIVLPKSNDPTSHDTSTLEARLRELVPRHEYRDLIDSLYRDKSLLAAHAKMGRLRDQVDGMDRQLNPTHHERLRVERDDSEREFRHEMNRLLLAKIRELEAKDRADRDTTVGFGDSGRPRPIELESVFKFRRNS